MAPPARVEATSWAHRYPLLCLVNLALLAYCNAFRGAFLFDDLTVIRDNPAIRDLGAMLSWDGYLAARHRFVGYLSFGMNYAVGKLDVRGYHLVNVCIHAVNACLVYALVLLAFRTPRLRASALARTSQAIALLAAALFATHPIQTQAVTYISQRFASLATLFCLLAVVLFLRWRLLSAAGGASRATGAALHAAVLASAVLAMETKEIAFTLPLAVVLCDLSFFEPVPWRRRLFLVPVAATMAIVPLTWLSAVGRGVGAGAVAQATRVETSVSRLDYLLTQGPVVATYLRLLVWPTGQNLDHDVPLAHGPFEPRVLGSGLLLLGLLALAVLLYRRTAPGRAQHAADPAIRLVAFGIAWFFLTLAVESSVIPIADVMFEHRVYLPSVGLFAGASVVAAFLVQRARAQAVGRGLVVVAAIASAVLGVATFRRNQVWADGVSLWSDSAEKSPGKSRPRENLGTALMNAGRLEEAVRELRRALQMNPDSSYAHGQMGAALAALGRDGEAEAELRAAIRLRPGHFKALFNLGQVLHRNGRAGEARAAVRRCLELAPADFEGRPAAQRLLEG